MTMFHGRTRSGHGTFLLLARIQGCTLTWRVFVGRLQLEYPDRKLVVEAIFIRVDVAPTCGLPSRQAVRTIGLAP